MYISKRNGQHKISEITVPAADPLNDFVVNIYTLDAELDKRSSEGSSFLRQLSSKLRTAFKETAKDTVNSMTAGEISGLIIGILFAIGSFCSCCYCSAQFRKKRASAIPTTPRRKDNIIYFFMC